jgi:hypothetical protein
MKNTNRLLLGVAGALALVSSATAQYIGWSNCIDPQNTAPYSVPFGSIGVGNSFINVIMGTGGTVTYGGQNGPCYAPNARTMENRGRFAIFNGPVGSVQTDFDDNLFLTEGSPNDPVGDYCYARIVSYPSTATDDNSKSYPFIDDKIQGYFVGASKTYFQVVGGDETARVKLTIRILGDAARWEWELTNPSTTEAKFMSVRFGACMSMLSSVPDSTGHTQANAGPIPRGYLPKPLGVTQADGTQWGGYTVTNTTKPLRVERNFLATRSSFPDYVKFMFGQLEAYGLRVDTVPTTETPDATRSAQIIVGNHGQFQSPGLLVGNVMRGRVFGDFGSGDPVLNPAAAPAIETSDTFLSDTSFINTYQPALVAPGGVRKVIYYLRSPWSVGDYRDPYTSLVDAPRIISATDDPTATNGLDPNPMRIVAYIDNQYATVDREVPMTNVRVSMLLPEGGGLRLIDGETILKTIDRIQPRNIAQVEWQVEADGKAFGKLPYTIRIEPTVGPTRELKGSVLVAATPTVRLAEGPNLISFPWNFSDTALDSIFGLKAGVDYLAYKWQGDTGEYIPVSSSTRGGSLWIVPLSDLGYLKLKGATAPTDANIGGEITVLRPGWNMIGNPYQFPIVLGTLTAVAEDAPADAMTWQELVDSSLVNSSLAYWVRNPEDPSSGTYAFTEGSADRLLPSTGYWIFVNSYNPIKLIWPAIYDETLPGATRSAKTNTTAWTQSDKQWRLQLAARSQDGIDSSNFIGVAASSQAATRLKLQEPPSSPNSKLQMSIVDSTIGQTTRLSQSLADSSTRKEWTLSVNSKTAGEVTVTWPNISTVPRNVRFQLVDKASNTTRDLRFASSYTYRQDAPGSRELTIQMEPGVPGRAVIVDAVVTRPTRDARAPFTISYSLSAQATTTIRILGGAGKEVYTVTRGRADRVGENTATWTMRDNANRAVAPGTYQVEILAETVNGERVRKIVPINVVR